MSEPSEVWTLPHHVGRRVLVFDEVTSTNDLAIQRSEEDDAAGLVILAKAQTAGRGQHGRTWSASPGSSVLLSAIVSPPEAIRRAPILTAWAAVAVCSTVEDFASVEPRIKWPNDILVDGQKVAGILIEQGRCIVAGIGLNVVQNEVTFREQGLPDATSLRQHNPDCPPSEDVARTLLGHLDRIYSDLCQGDVTGLERNWRTRIGLLDRDVIAETTEGDIEGRLVELTFDVVVMSTDQGHPVITKPEKLLHLRASPGSRD